MIAKKIKLIYCYLVLIICMGVFVYNAVCVSYPLQFFFQYLEPSWLNPYEFAIQIKQQMQRTRQLFYMKSVLNSIIAMALSSLIFVIHILIIRHTNRKFEEGKKHDS
jgi:hypothetical protein